VNSESLTSGTGRRHFLLLQGPCGNFFRELQVALRAKGHRCTRIALNGGDLVHGGLGMVTPYRRSLDDWAAWVTALCARRAVTDIVCYGDCRPYHRRAIAALKPLGIAVHVLEEGYLRPHWVTCERDGVNGHSKLVDLDLSLLDEDALDATPARGEDSFQSSPWHYAWAGFAYYLWAMLLTPLFPRYVSHRDLSIPGEAVLWLGRIFSWPVRRSRTERTLKLLNMRGKPIHLVLLQLSGDSQIKEHSDFKSMRHFVEHCVAEYAAAGNSEALLVFKNHPLDNGVINLRTVIRAAASGHGVAERVFFVETGKLVPLLDRTISVTAVNSTACHQALRRGIPTLVLGRAVFNHPEITPRMRLADFFRLRPVADLRRYELLVALLRQTNQVFGGYYSRTARDIVLPALTDRLIQGSPDLQAFVRTGRPESHPRAAS
jgi:capsular polysaccharide export protein